MARLTDQAKLAAFAQILNDWSCTGSILYTPLADGWLRGNLARCTQKSMNKLLRDYFRAGGAIDEVAETREGWREQWDFHYDLRLPFRDRTLYFETRLCLDLFDPSDTPTVLVANLHWA